MTPLSELRRDYQRADRAFLDLLEARFGVDRYAWYRALAHIEGGIGRWNDDTSRDEALAADADLRAAHDEYIRLLHVFYRARDGEHGFLGTKESRA